MSNSASKSASSPKSTTGTMKQLVLIDGHSLAYRMYFALERTGMKTSKKQPTWAVYGFFKALFDLLKQTQPDGMAVAFDMGRITFRNDIYPEYKANRESMPDDMREQMDAIRKGIELLGIPIFELPNYEADDVIGTLARQAAKENVNVVILTGDQDAFQIIDTEDKISLLLPSFKGGLSTYDRHKVFEKWGVHPEQVTDFKGLKGDTSDNIPGVPGVGDKTAAKLLAEYETLENVLANIDAISGKKLKENLTAYKEQALMSKDLATIRYDSPVTFTQDACHLSIPDEVHFKEFLVEMEFRSFLGQFDTLIQPFKQMELFGDEGSDPLTQPAKTNGKGLSTPPTETSSPKAIQENVSQESASLQTELPRINDHVDFSVLKSLDELDGIIEAIQAHGVFAFDFETSSLNCFQNELAGVSLSWAKGFKVAYRPPKNILKLNHYPETVAQLQLKRKLADIKTVYIPLRHPETDACLPESEVLKRLAILWSDTQVVQIAHNAKFELNQCRAAGQPVKGLVFDTMVASYVHNPNAKHNLKGLCFEILGHPMQEITELIGKGKKQIPFTEVPLEQAAYYAAADARVTLELAHYFVQHLDPDKQALLYELELPLVPVLAAMEWEGVSIDKAYLSELGQTIDKKIETVEKAIYKAAGCEFNLNSPKQVGDILFGELGIPPKGKTKTGYSTNAKVLESLAHEHPIVQKILDYRQFFKLKSTYVDVLPDLVEPKDNRLHTSFNQTITTTGRLSSSDPNLQNIPIRSELGRSIRRAFVPANKKGWSMVSADYSQIELRLLAHFSQAPKLVEAFCQGQDIHAATAALVFDVPLKDVSKEMRYRAKAVNFGIIYGQTPYGLSQALDIAPREAAEFIDKYFDTYPQVKSYIESVIEQAHQDGYAKTLFGRVRDLKDDLNNKTKFIREFAERAAFNTPLQGSAADIMKVAMIRAQQALHRGKFESKLILQVHDELVLEVKDEEKAAVIDLVKDAMALEQPLHVPLVIDVSSGPTWMEVEE